MKNTFLIMILMTGLMVALVIGNQVTASVLNDQSCHPELVSSHPELVSGPPQLASVGHSELVSASCPETTISASVSSSIETTIGEPSVPSGKGNFFLNNWGALLMGLLGFSDLIARLTPSAKDNSIINFISSVINAVIPNLKKGGGRL